MQQSSLIEYSNTQEHFQHVRQ